MRKFFTLTFILFAIAGYSQNNDTLYKIASWKGFTKAAVTYTFDDACANQYTVAIPMFNEFNFDATFFPVSGWGPNWTNFRNAADEGHEIASHTVNHGNFSSVTDSAKQNDELRLSQEAINSKIKSALCHTIAYPYCAPSKLEYTKKYYIAARHCQGNIESKTPGDFYNISSVIVGDQGSIKTAADFNNKVKATAKTNGWLVYLIHGIDKDGGYSPVPSPELRQGLDFLHANRNEYWVSTFYNVVQYIRERDCAKVNELEVKTDTITLELKDTLDNKIYRYPLTIRRSFPEGWNFVAVSQSGKQVITKYTEIEGKKYVDFNAIPDSGIIILTNVKESAELLEVIPTVVPYTPSVNTGLESKNTMNFKFSPNPFSEAISIEATTSFNYALYTIDGRLMESGSANNAVQAGNLLQKGVYLLKVTNDSELMITKVFKK